MRWKLLLWITLLGFLTSNGQNPTADSIKAIRQRIAAEPSDTGKAKQMNLLSYYYQFYNLDTALLIAREAYQLAEKNKFVKGQARSLGVMGVIFNKSGNYPKALETYLEQLKYLEKLGYTDEIASTYLTIAMVYSGKKEMTTALQYAYRADSISRKHSFNDLLPYIRLNIGNIYIETNQPDSALYYTTLAYDSAMAQQNVLIAGTALNNLGNMYVKISEPLKAIQYYRQSIPLLESMRDDNTLAECYLGMGKAFDHLKEKDSALYYGRKSFKLAAANDYLQQSVYATQFLSDLFREKGNIDSAFNYQQSYMQLKDSFDNGEKLKELHNLTLNEQLRQDDISRERLLAEKERKLKLQLLFIGMLIPLFFLLSAFISRKKVNKRIVELSGIFSLLFLFEYITLLLHPVVANKSGHSPIIEIIVFVTLAAMLSPAHHKIEHWFVTHLTRKHHQSREARNKKGQIPDLPNED